MITAALTVHDAAHFTNTACALLYKPGLDLYIAVLVIPITVTLKTKIQEIAGISISIHTLNMAMDIPVCISIEDIINAMSRDAELQIIIGVYNKRLTTEQR